MQVSGAGIVPRSACQVQVSGAEPISATEEEPRRVYPSSKAVADLASEIHSLFPAEIPKHLPVSQLLTA